MAEAPKKRTFKTFSYRGVDLDDLLTMQHKDVIAMFTARHKRKLARRGIPRPVETLMRKLVESRKDVPQGEKPKTIKTRLRNVTIVPQMIGSMVGIYNGKTYLPVEIKPEMIGHYLGEFALTYKPCFHSKAGAKGMQARFLPF